MISVPAFYPEGPTVDGRDVLWVEMTMDRARRWKSGVAETVWQESDCGPTSIKRTAGGSYWVLCHLAHKVLRLSSSFNKELEITTDADGRPIAWPNDCVADSKGRLFVTDSGIFSLAASPQGYVVLIDWDGKARRIAGPLRYANGISLDEANRTLFVSEHLNRRILKMQLDADDNVVKTSVYFDFGLSGLSRPDYAMAGPDGQLLRDNGELLVADYGAGRIVRIGADGALISAIPVPMPFVTNMVQSPFDAREIVVTGASSDESVLQVGRVLSLRYRD
jgi:sugar lactone lactonase YvrE